DPCKRALDAQLLDGGASGVRQEPADQREPQTGEVAGERPPHADRDEQVAEQPAHHPPAPRRRAPAATHPPQPHAAARGGASWPPPPRHSTARRMRPPSMGKAGMMLKMARLRLMIPSQ